MLRSYWNLTAPGTKRAPLEEGAHCDVAIVGGGIVGLTAAYLLSREGLSVTLLEARRLAQQVTGATTAKLTSLHGLVYSRLAESRDREAARLYGESQQEALHLVRRIAQDEEIDCDLEDAPAYSFCSEPGGVEALRREADLAAQLGLPADFVDSAPAPFPVAGAVRFRDQAQFHPRKYLLTLADRAESAGCRIYEDSRVTAVSEGRPCRVETGRGSITAGSVIVATHLPILDRGGFFSVAYPFAHVVLAARLDQPRDIGGMYLRVEPPTRSVRTHDGGRVLIATGDEFKAGKSDGSEEMAGLEAWVTEFFPDARIEQRWTNHDLKTPDGLPLIGRLTSRSDHIHVATGFGAWGMTGGTLAAMILSETLQGRESAWAGLYDSTRSSAASGVGTFLKENLDVARSWAGDRFSGSRAAPEDLQPGEARIFSRRDGKVAAHRDEAGNLIVRSAVCPHMGCIVAWNDIDRSWDCPCHGSRFEPDGRVLFGPAVEPLAEKEIS